MLLSISLLPLYYAEEQRNVKEAVIKVYTVIY